MLRSNLLPLFMLILTAAPEIGTAAPQNGRLSCERLLRSARQKLANLSTHRKRLLYGERWEEWEIDQATRSQGISIQTDYETFGLTPGRRSSRDGRLELLQNFKTGSVYTTPGAIQHWVRLLHENYGVSFFQQQSADSEIGFHFFDPSTRAFVISQTYLEYPSMFEHYLEETFAFVKLLDGLEEMGVRVDPFWNLKVNSRDKAMGALVYNVSAKLKYAVNISPGYFIEDLEGAKAAIGSFHFSNYLYSHPLLKEDYGQLLWNKLYPEDSEENEIVKPEIYGPKQVVRLNPLQLTEAKDMFKQLSKVMDEELGLDSDSVLKSLDVEGQD